MLNVVMLSVIKLSVVMLSAIMMNVVMLNVVMLNVVMLSVVAPRDHPVLNFRAPFVPNLIHKYENRTEMSSTEKMPLNFLFFKSKCLFV